MTNAKQYKISKCSNCQQLTKTKSIEFVYQILTPKNPDTHSFLDDRKLWLCKKCCNLLNNFDQEFNISLFTPYVIHYGGFPKEFEV